MLGVVGTAFGLHARHGGPDNRTIPGAQPVGEVAAQLADLIEWPRNEIYTRPEYQDLVVRYFAAEDPAVVEGAPPFRR
jgi:hypothetical protein